MLTQTICFSFGIFIGLGAGVYLVKKNQKRQERQEENKELDPEELRKIADELGDSIDELRGLRKSTDELEDSTNSFVENAKLLKKSSNDPFEHIDKFFGFGKKKKKN